MNEAEARALAERRNADGAGAGLRAARRRADGAWEVVVVGVPGMHKQKPSGAHVESRPRPEAPADPRPAILQNIPPYGAG